MTVVKKKAKIQLNILGIRFWWRAFENSLTINFSTISLTLNDSDIKAKPRDISVDLDEITINTLWQLPVSTPWCVNKIPVSRFYKLGLYSYCPLSWRNGWGLSFRLQSGSFRFQGNTCQDRIQEISSLVPQTSQAESLVWDRAWMAGMEKGHGKGGGMNPFLRCPDTISPLKPQHDTVHLSVEPV